MIEPTMLVGRYEIGDVIGRGGMAEVHRGRDVRLGRTVAIKMLRVDLVGDSTFQERFRREAQSSASLNHPNIVAVYDTGEDVHQGVRVPFIVMEFVEGRTLRDMIHEGSRITHERALELVAEICDALEYSHRAGIVHRDIKPGNVMVTPSGQVKVMDFGIARAMAAAGQTMTQTAMVVGTAQYLSPEQARGETADARSDLYATGCVLYELLVGRPPFTGDSLVSVAMAHVKEPAVAPSALDPSIPRDVDAIVLKALAKDRTERYQSAPEMARDLRRALSGIPVTATVDADSATAYMSPAAVAAAAAAEQGLDTTSEQALGEEGERPPDHRRGGYGWLIAGVILVLALAGVAGYLIFSPSEEARVPSVVGQTLEQATATLEGDGFEVGGTTERADDEVEAGKVLSQSPEEGQLLELGSAVDLVLSTGKEQVNIPRVVGLNVADARAALEAVGLDDIDVKNQASDRPSGEVLACDPPEGRQVDVGSKVTLTVSSGQVEVPDVVGRTLSQAQATLTQAGFDVPDPVEEESDERAGTVIAQTPEGGTLADQGSRVVLTVAIPRAQTPTPSPSPTEQAQPDDQNGADTTGTDQTEQTSEAGDETGDQAGTVAEVVPPTDPGEAHPRGLS
jgi:serine/threonine-protein kinase